MAVHPSHVTRFSDASTFDEICINCGARDTTWDDGDLVYPCSNLKELVEDNPVIVKIEKKKE